MGTVHPRQWVRYTYDNGYGTPTVMGTVHLRTTVYYTSTQGHAAPICHIVCEQVVLCPLFLSRPLRMCAFLCIFAPF